MIQRRFDDIFKGVLIGVVLFGLCLYFTGCSTINLEEYEMGKIHAGCTEWLDDGRVIKVDCNEERYEFRKKGE